jgi:hypothetical protein
MGAAAPCLPRLGRSGASSDHASHRCRRLSTRTARSTGGTTGPERGSTQSNTYRTCIWSSLTPPSPGMLNVRSALRGKGSERWSVHCGRWRLVQPYRCATGGGHGVADETAQRFAVPWAPSRRTAQQPSERDPQCQHQDRGDDHRGNHADRPPSGRRGRSSLGTVTARVAVVIVVARLRCQGEVYCLHYAPKEGDGTAGERPRSDTQGGSRASWTQLVRHGTPYRLLP